MNLADINQRVFDRLSVYFHRERDEMGKAAGQRAASILERIIRDQGAARIIVASAPSQNEMLAALASSPMIDWSKVSVFHMDEYVGLDEAHPASFRHYQRKHFLAKVRPKVFHGIRGEAEDLQGEIDRYTELFNEATIDLVCMGIGENGHIAFNDPSVADFNDPATMKMVKLDPACRRQQVNDGCFPTLADVPHEALSLTCTALMSAREAVCTVPGKLKATAVRNTLLAPVGEVCPATILRQHPSASLYLDADAASQLDT